jgi:hypothetical protein
MLNEAKSSWRATQAGRTPETSIPEKRTQQTQQTQETADTIKYYAGATDVM